jgi:A/G-specific adenine glycosylase
MRGRKFLVARRKEEGLLGGLWEFPGGKIRRGETAQEALAREFREEVGVEIAVGEKFVEVPHKYSHFSVRLHAFHCRAVRGRARPLRSSAVRWVASRGLRRLAFPTANRRILAALQKK